MKSLILALMILFAVTGCETRSQTEQTLEGSSKSSIAIPKLDVQGPWVLHRLEGKEISKDLMRTPPELFLDRDQMRFSGNDGCNRIFGQLEAMSDQGLKFGKVASTRMACPEMKFPQKVQWVLSAVQSYRLKEAKLTLYDESGEEIAEYQKKET